MVPLWSQEKWNVLSAAIRYTVIKQRKVKISKVVKTSKSCQVIVGCFITFLCFAWGFGGWFVHICFMYVYIWSLKINSCPSSWWGTLLSNVQLCPVVTGVSLLGQSRTNGGRCEGQRWVTTSNLWDISPPFATISFRLTRAVRAARILYIYTYV